MYVKRHQRLPGYNYASTGAYFVTVCAAGHRPLFGCFNSGAWIPSPLGEILQKHIELLPCRQPGLTLDEWVIMPNHFHAIIWLDKNLNTRTLSNVIGSLKSGISHEFNAASNTRAKIWQTSFYDHIIRNEDGLLKIREYIQQNPAKWQEDRFYTS